VVEDDTSTDISKLAQECFRQLRESRKDIPAEELTFKYEYRQRQSIDDGQGLDHTAMYHIWLDMGVTSLRFLQKCIEWNLSRPEAQRFLDSVVSGIVKKFRDTPETKDEKMYRAGLTTYSSLCVYLSLDNKFAKKPETVQAGIASGFREYKEL
jgi:hypothetical protein